MFIFQQFSVPLLIEQWRQTRRWVERACIEEWHVASGWRGGISISTEKTETYNEFILIQPQFHHQKTPHPSTPVEPSEPPVRDTTKMCLQSIYHHLSPLDALLLWAVWGWVRRVLPRAPTQITMQAGIPVWSFTATFPVTVHIRQKNREGERERERERERGEGNIDVAWYHNNTKTLRFKTDRCCLFALTVQAPTH